MRASISMRSRASRRTAMRRTIGLRFLAGKNFAGGRGNITIGGEYNESRVCFFDDRRQTSTTTGSMWIRQAPAAGYLQGRAYPVDLALWDSAGHGLHQYRARRPVFGIYLRRSSRAMGVTISMSV